MKLFIHLILIIYILTLNEQILYSSNTSLYFKISIDGQSYYENVLFDINSVDDKLHYLAVKLIEKTFNIEDINSDFYQINIYYNVSYLNSHVDMYNIMPLFNDRFRHVVWVRDNYVVREEVYDLSDRLLYAFAFLNYDDKEEKVKKIYRKIQIDSVPLAYYKGFYAIYRKYANNVLQVIYSDGLNNFSFFKKKYKKVIQEENKIVFANYVYRTSKNGYIYAVVGTVPFNEMKRFVKAYIKKEDKLE